MRAADPATTVHGPNRWRRYERDRPGELIHLDVKKLGHTGDGGGWWAHGRDSTASWASGSAPRVGYDDVHVAVDDHSRLAYVEVITAARAARTGRPARGFCACAADFYAAHGVRVERVMTDNALAYTGSHLLADIQGSFPAFTITGASSASAATAASRVTDWIAALRTPDARQPRCRPAGVGGLLRPPQQIQLDRRLSIPCPLEGGASRARPIGARGVDHGPGGQFALEGCPRRAIWRPARPARPALSGRAPPS